MRDEYLRSQGITILRFSNHEVHKNRDIVLQRIGVCVLELKGGSAH